MEQLAKMVTPATTEPLEGTEAFMGAAAAVAVVAAALIMGAAASRAQSA